MIDKKAYQKMDYALCLLSAHADGKDRGCIINSFHQVTSSFPAKFTIAVNRENVTAAAVEQAGSFCVTLLAHDAPAALINDFGYRSGRVADKFSPYEVRRDEVGNPYLTDSMVSRVSCRVIDRLEIGSYTLYVGQAVPPTATVYREMVGGGFKCSVCGYIHESETLRDDFICPICRATADKFVRQK